MSEALMTGIRLYYEAVMQKKYAGKLFRVLLNDVVDSTITEYNREIVVEVADDYYGKKGYALVIKGSRTNLMAQEPRLIDAFMKGQVLEVVGRYGAS